MRSEGKVQIDQKRLTVQPSRDRPRNIMRDSRRADPTLCARHRDYPADRLCGRSVVKSRDLPDEPHRLHGRDDIIAHTARNELPIEFDIVEMSDHHYLRAWIAALRQLIQLFEQHSAIRGRLQNDKVRRRGGAICFDRGWYPADVDFHMRLVHASILRSAFDRLRHGARFDEHLDRNPRHRRNGSFQIALKSRHFARPLC